MYVSHTENETDSNDKKVKSSGEAINNMGIGLYWLWDNTIQLMSVLYKLCNLSNATLMSQHRSCT